MSERDELAEVIKPAAAFDYWPQEAARLALAAGYRKPRTIETARELNDLPDGSAILDNQGDVAQKLNGWWHFPETAPMGSSKVVKYGAVTVLYTPEPLP